MQKKNRLVCLEEGNLRQERLSKWKNNSRVGNCCGGKGYRQEKKRPTRVVKSHRGDYGPVIRNDVLHNYMSFLPDKSRRRAGDFGHIPRLRRR